MSCGTLWRGYCFSNKIQMLLGSTINDATINDAALKTESLYWEFQANTRHVTKFFPHIK